VTEPGEAQATPARAALREARAGLPAAVRWARGWLLTTNHTRVGILYLLVTFLWFIAAGIDALAVRAQLAFPDLSLFKPDVYNALFTIHGTQMLFLFAIPVFTGFANVFVPRMVGAKDMAYPRLNALGFWLILWAGILLHGTVLFKNDAAAGWTSYVPLANAAFTPGHGEDWYIGSVFLETVASTIAAINLLVTIYRARKPGLGWSRMPVFVWGVATTSWLAALAGPVLLADLSMLFMDRYFGTLFFDPSHPEGALLWQHLFWFYSHPATYIMILPAFGIISTVIPAFSGKPLFSSRAVALSITAIAVVQISVFWHHMFVTGQDATLSLISMAGSLAVSIPNGVLVYNWIMTMWGGRVQLTSAMLFALGFIALFTIGGADGAVESSIPLNVDLHATYWNIAHIHFILFGGSAMAVFAGFYYWWPEMFGRRLDERLGRWHFALTMVGAVLSFFPMHVLGLEGMTRRIWTYDLGAYAGWNLLETVGSMLLGLSVALFAWNMARSLLRGSTPSDQPFADAPRSAGSPAASRAEEA
jgi:heme/copper-type cytochrome/quinol oxidase subunit 1